MQRDATYANSDHGSDTDSRLVMGVACDKAADRLVECATRVGAFSMQSAVSSFGTTLQSWPHTHDHKRLHTVAITAAYCFQLSRHSASGN